MNEFFLETYCNYGELDQAIPALFELPGVPIPDGQINRAVERVKKDLDLDHAPYPLHFKAKYSADEGTLTIYQVVYGNRTPKTFARRNAKGMVEFLDPLWGIRGLPSLVKSGR